MGVNSITRFLVILAVVLGSVLSSYAQEVPEVVKDETGSYYIHLVEKGQTLYAISKKYAVPLEAISNANPGISSSGIKIGQTLRIPVSEMDKREFKKSEVEIEGDTILHTVVKKETLYSISKKYSLSIQEIAEINPQINTGLQPGMQLKIPYAQSDDADPLNMKVAREDSLQFHVVQPKETLYSLSKLYSVSIDTLQILNNGLPEGLKVGAAIRVPKQNPKYELAVQQEAALQDSLSEEMYEQSQAYKIAYFLPFYGSKNDTLDSLDVRAHPSGIYRNSTIALDFYRGSKLAIDSLAKQGLWAEVSVFDTENNTDTVRSIMAKDSMHTYDLFIGPLYRSHFEYIGDFAKQFDIPIVSPVKVSSRVLLDRPTAIKIHPGKPAHLIALAQFAVNEFGDSNLFFLNTARFNEQDDAKLFLKYANKELATLGKDSIQEVDIYTISRKRILQVVQDSTHYTIVMISENQAYVSELLTILNDVYLSKRGITFTVIGPEKWAEFDNIETSYRMNLDVHVSATDFVNYESEAVNTFIRSFRHRYGSDPEEFAIIGFEVSYKMLSALHQHGPFMLKHLGDHKAEGLSKKYNFIRVGAESGFENGGVFIYRIEDYKRIRVN
jgi:LysM repeat protein